ncbi:LuxR C-terminal-related transcriptional regulator [Mycolicibacterium fortuitum]|uniref:LuxR C-terminal-related transcriptional regulator n=2 Tax=Mycolicibacterium fortuitum TaxID=1766 RepID=A0AAE5AEM7_MYCFO|nr:LuxR C-terminal-related transcriptional regulator [Mycolicibacterium fortuitum]MCV7142509.1 GAF domain-containing protein [Mycolicibacterium fortuitum]MDV7193390.1 LuxR C-terminal-related transcriptional regulator [Mycolicibacterium fortuitum]MDV7206841.1 LuxR C-terminal-related transcriptional regulator [Mycolicibacterium fortuitum]MDV7228359.1 LuxR C-terminal-related transcriptional regulator [Mycolicibacterium fortuitum]MDV7260467.1 LuxR C-terminal-related transcriptional regulator [Myco
MSVLIGGESSRAAGTGRVRADWSSKQAEFSERFSALRAQVVGVLGIEGPPGLEADSPAQAGEVISDFSRLCALRLRAVPSSDTETERQLYTLLLRLQQLAMDWYLFETGVRSQRLADCAVSLNRLRAMPTTAALVDNACHELVFRLGFRRAVLSTVDAAGWKPLILLDRTEVANRAWFSAWQNQPVPLMPATPEAVSLSRRQPTLIQDTADAPVYRPLIVQAGQSRSYVVAPLVQGSDVMGFLHIDHYPETTRVDEADRDVLWAFADGFSHIYQRAALLENLRQQRDTIRDMLITTVDQIDDLCDLGTDAAAWSSDDRANGHDLGAAPGSHAPHRVELTERESEVLRLMVTGASNHEIADQLVITEGTVKSHVKHILRKYGAVNRAQAIAWALQST